MPSIMSPRGDGRPISMVTQEYTRGFFVNRYVSDELACDFNERFRSRRVSWRWKTRSAEDELSWEGDPLRGSVALSCQPLKQELGGRPSNLFHRAIDKRNWTRVEQRNIGPIAGDQ